MQKNTKIEIDGFTFNIIFSEAEKRGIPLLALHGFTGSANDLSFLAEFIPNNFIIIAPDLPGHGNSFPIENMRFYEIPKIVELLNNLLISLEFEKVVLLGYSMGGRIAYSFAAKYPEKILGMIIESSTPGIKDENEREKRKEADKLLANKILNEGVFSFVDYWLSLPIFKSLKNLDARLYEKLRADKMSNSPLGLANSLMFTGAGNMRPVWTKLRDFKFPVLLINGKLDGKYSEINREASELLPNVEHREVENAGHNVHLEKPHEFIILVNSFLKKITERN